MRWVPALLVVAACSTGTTGAIATSTPTPTPVSPSTSPAPTITPTPPVPTWVLGASPLPLRSDGFGQVLPTPRLLRDRHLQAADVLPAPPDGAFHWSQRTITSRIRQRMGSTYKAGCPTSLADLRYLTLVFRGFDSRAHTGELVVRKDAVPHVVAAFRRLFGLGFPLEEMRLPGTADMNEKPTGDGNDTASFVCRPARGQTRFSAHAYGLAVDVNPFQNPYVKGDLVLPELASAYRDRSWRRDGMFLAGSPAVRAFTDNGFTWGGTFSRPTDYQHMTLTGN
ncbi:MAG: hypothetical protein QOG99_1620 [Frankiales bacterium]|jgi:hypothetical protein|nr:hypothetical protein [Frankiales bacterium]